MKKYRATKMANGGKSPIVPDKKMPNKVKVSGSQDTTTTTPTVKLQGVTVVAKKGEGIKKMSFGTPEFQQKRDSLMTAGVSAFLKGKPKGYKISDEQRSNIKAEVRDALIKGGQQYRALAFKDTSKPLTAADIAETNRYEAELRRKKAAAAAPGAPAPFSAKKK